MQGAGAGFRTLAQLEQNQELLRLPDAIIPRLAWPGCLTLLAAREKCGKSTLLTAAAAAISCGGQFLEQATTAGTVMWYSADMEPPFVLLQRFKPLERNSEQIQIVDTGLPLEDVLSMVLRSRPRLLVVDTLTGALSETVRDLNSAAEVTPHLLELRRLIARTQTSIVLVHHSSKATGRYRDSTALGACVDVIAEVVDAQDDGSAREVRVVGRFSRETFRYRLQEGGRVTLDALVGISLDARMFALIEREAGLSSSTLCARMGVRKQDGCASIGRLARDGRIANRGTARRASWVAVGVSGSSGSR